MIRNLEQLEEEQRTTSHLVHRIKNLQNLIKATQGDAWQDAAHTALSMISTDEGRMAATALVAFLIEEEVRALQEAGVDIVVHIHYPGVTFNGYPIRDREQGSPRSALHFDPGADGAVVRAIRNVHGMNGAWQLRDDGTLSMTVSEDMQGRSSKGASGSIPNGAQVTVGPTE